MNEKDKKTLFALNRAQGQIQGIRKMVISKKPLLDMLQQIEAVKCAMKSLEKNLLIDELLKKKTFTKKELDYICKLMR